MDNVHKSDQQPQAGQQQVRLTIDERELQSSYANAFRTNGTAEEVMLDFGVNLARPATAGQGQAEIAFHVSQRIILNYYSAKRLMLALGQLVRQHEERFGELELDANKRAQRKQEFQP